MFRPATPRQLNLDSSDGPDFARCHCRNSTADTMTNKNPIRLPPLRVLRVRHANRAEANPCVTVMSSVLGMLCHFIPAPAGEVVRMDR